MLSFKITVALLHSVLKLMIVYLPVSNIGLVFKVTLKIAVIIVDFIFILYIFSILIIFFSICLIIVFHASFLRKFDLIFYCFHLLL